MAVTFGPTIRNLVCEQVITAANGGKFEIWTNATFTGTKLASFDLGNPAFTGPTNGTIVANAIAPKAALATGTAAAWRIIKDSTLVITGSIGVAGSNSDWEIAAGSALITQGQMLVVNNFVYQAPF